MFKKLSIFCCFLLLITLVGCSDSQSEKDLERAENDASSLSPSTAVDKQENLLVRPWQGPFQGVPAFDKMNLNDLKSALELAMQRKLEEIEAITSNPEAANFDNTILALETAGHDLDRVDTYRSIWRSNISSAEFRSIQAEMVPVLSKFSSSIIQNEALFKRIRAVHDSDTYRNLSPEKQRLVKLIYEDYAHNGATLSQPEKKRYAEISARLAQLQTQFSNNILHDEESYTTYLTENQLGGLPDSYIKAAKAAAEDRGKTEQYAVLNTRSSMDPFLTYSTERELREQVWNNYYNRGDNGDEFDNNAIIQEILTLRLERAKLLGYESFAHWQLSNRMAKHPDNAMQLMLSVWPAAIARVKEEVNDMQSVADAQDAGIRIKPWDYRFYAEKVRQVKYSLDSDEVKQYIQLDKLRNAMFYVAGRVFDFDFIALPEGKVPVFHPDVKVWEVKRKSTGEHIGLWYLDPFARQGKRSGAWAVSYRNHDTVSGVSNVLSSNNSNFVKGAEGEPVLISWDDAQTFFHEFGHALHALSSSVDYPRFNTGVRDYTEFQSQLLERWLTTDEVIKNYLTHYQTGAPIPATLVAKIKKAANFNQGFKTTEYLASALMDMKFHTTNPEDLDPDQFERQTLTSLGMPEEVVMRHRSPQFKHIFGGQSYAAGYYGYMWADVLTSDAAEAFVNSTGGFYNEALSERLVNYLFSIRNAMDPVEAYRLFRGRDATYEPLMRDRGFPIPKSTEKD